MRFGIFSNTYPPKVNGVVAVVRTLKTGLENLGHGVFVFTVQHPEAVQEDRRLWERGVEGLSDRDGRTRMGKRSEERFIHSMISVHGE